MRKLLVAVALLYAPLTLASSEPIHFWVGFGTTQHEVRPGTNPDISYVPVLVFSNAPNESHTLYHVAVVLRVSESTTNFNCYKQVRATSTFVHGVPVGRFEVAYPPPKHATSAPPQVPYYVHAEVTWGGDQPQGTHNDMKLELPAGGVPRCVGSDTFAR